MTSSISNNHHPLTKLLDSLSIPQDFKNYGDSMREKEDGALNAWSRAAVSQLQDVESIARAGLDAHDIDALSNIIARVSPFAYDPRFLNEEEGFGAYEEERNVLQREAPWITEDAKRISRDILARFEASRKPSLVKQVLETIVKPIFRASNPHPHINMATGRSLPPSSVGRAPQQGGMSSVTQDFFDEEGQKWKEFVGLGAVLYWCVDNIEPGAYNDMWYLVVPPLMTFLDDYQPRYKFWGLLIARRMLRDVPSSLLLKTGIQGLLQSSLKKILAHQDSPLSPSILRLAISQSLQLVVMTNPEGSKARFDTLCDLLGEGVINNIWTYTFDKPEVVRATLEALPPLFKALDIGCVRFIQSLLPQLLHPLVSPSSQGVLPGQQALDLVQLQLQIAALRPLIALIQVTAPRMKGWRLTILDALVRCWITMVVDRSGGTTTTESPYCVGGMSHETDSDDEEGGDGGAHHLEYTSRPVDLVDYESVKPGNLSSVHDNLKAVTTLLQMAAYQLAQVSPSLVQVEYPQLVEKEPNLSDMFPRNSIQG